MAWLQIGKLLWNIDNKNRNYIAFLKFFNKFKIDQTLILFSDLHGT